MMTRIVTPLKANFTVVVPNATDCVRSTRDWQALAKTLGMHKGRDAAKMHAGTYGSAVMVWNNGHTVLYVKDEESGDLIRIKFNG